MPVERMSMRPKLSLRKARIPQLKSLQGDRKNNALPTAAKPRVTQIAVGEEA